MKTERREEWKEEARRLLRGENKPRRQKEATDNIGGLSLPYYMSPVRPVGSRAEGGKVASPAQPTRNKCSLTP